MGREMHNRMERGSGVLFTGILDIVIPLMYSGGDHAFVLLKEKLGKRSGKKNTAVGVVRLRTRLTSSGVSESLAHVHYMVTRHPNPLFTGRKNLLQELDGIVRDAIKDLADQPRRALPPARL
jgi:hypothetical protein